MKKHFALFLLLTWAIAQGSASYVNGGGGGGGAPTDSPNFTTQVTFASTYHLEPSEVNDGTCSTTKTMDLSTGSSRKLTMGGNCTLTLTNPTTGGTYILRLLEDATGGRVMTWPVAVKWPGGTTPSLSGANKIDIITLYYDGTSYYGSSSLNY